MPPQELMQYAALAAAKVLRTSPASSVAAGSAVAVEVPLPFPVLHGLGNGLAGSDQACRPPSFPSPWRVRARRWLADAAAAAARRRARSRTGNRC